VIVVVYLVILVAGFFFLVVRPQRRQMAARRALIASVGVGDDVVTSGGIYGTVRSLGDDSVELEIAPAVVVTVARGAIAGRLTGSDEATNQLRSTGFTDDDPRNDHRTNDRDDDQHLDNGSGEDRPDAAGGAG
jgi:preprotein translocase subunit YajC